MKQRWVGLLCWMVATKASKVTQQIKKSTHSSFLPLTSILYCSVCMCSYYKLWWMWRECWYKANKWG